VIYSLIKRVLFLLPAETAHKVGFGLLRFLMSLPFVATLTRLWLAPRDPGLRVRAFGVEFPSPILLAAGFDKDAEGYEALGALGFGAIEVGTITGEPQPGNPRPRLFRLLRDRALLNRMGFNNHGAARAAARLAQPRSMLVGVNIGKTKLVSEDEAISDYVKSAELLGAYADYVVVNVSSPNTPGLRALQAVERLRPLLVAVKEALARVRPSAPPPLLVKIAPDLADEAIDEIGDLALELQLAGIIATNTTISREGLSTPGAEVAALGAGGLSGAPVKSRAISVLRRLRRRVGDRLVLIAAGGIENAEDAWERMRAGATLVQVYTGFVYEGPLLPSRMAKALLRRARQAGFPSLQSVIGTSDRASLPPTSGITAPITRVAS
jgi:dihydroorotate dehydrogenase